MNTGFQISFYVLSVLIGTYCATADDTANRNLADVINGFGISLFAKIAPSERNILISPLSLTRALTALYGGSQGTTADEIESVLNYNSTGLSRTEIKEAFKAIIDYQKNNKFQYDANFANSLWLKKGANVLAEFKSDVKTYFDTDIKEEDFTKPSATSDINSWISTQTKSTVAKAFDSNLDPATSLVLASGNYFKGKWATSFNPAHTKEDSFFVDGGNETVMVQMMHIDGKFPYANDIDINSELVEIPYDGGDLVMVIVMPKRFDGIREQESFFTLDNVKLALGEMSPIDLYLRIPRFNLSLSRNMNEHLKKMGIKQAFVPGQADFSKIDGAKDLSLSQVVGAGYVAIDEEGVAPAPESTAAPQIANTGYDFPKVNYMTVDHPFGFLIRHKPSGYILYIGRVMAP